MKGNRDRDAEDEAQALRGPEEGEAGTQEIWQLGDMSDEEDSGDTDGKPTPRGVNNSADDGVKEQEEGRRLIQDDEDDRSRRRRSTSSDATLTRNDGHERDAYDDDEFGEWNGGGKDYSIQ